MNISWDIWVQIFSTKKFTIFPVMRCFVQPKESMIGLGEDNPTMVQKSKGRSMFKPESIGGRKTLMIPSVVLPFPIWIGVRTV